MRYATHVAGIIAGNGILSNRKYIGIAPESNIVAVKILDASGNGDLANVLVGLQWVLDNKEKYDIRLCNLSIGSKDTGKSDPLVDAVEKLWDSGIVVVISAGNDGPENGSVTSPGVSRKVITVGALDDCDSINIWDDSVKNFSGRGPTKGNICKPDIIAPGTRIISCLSSTYNLKISNESDNKIINNNYIQLSGTSMATPIVSGSIALLMQKYPTIYPDDVKYMLKKCAFNLNVDRNQQGWGLIDVEKLFQLEGRHVRG